MKNHNLSPILSCKCILACLRGIITTIAMKKNESHYKL
jgi:hypothetical protein